MDILDAIGVGSYAGRNVGGRSLEAALPGEWAAFFLVLGALALIGAVILVITCLRHERVVLRRHARRVSYLARGAQGVTGDGGGGVGKGGDGGGNGVLPAKVHTYGGGSSRVATVGRGATRK